MIRARYIIGADGTHSVVRKNGENWNFDGHAVATQFALADVVLSGKDVDQLMNQRVNCFTTPKGNAKDMKQIFV